MRPLEAHHDSTFTVAKISMINQMLNLPIKITKSTKNPGKGIFPIYTCQIRTAEDTKISITFQSRATFNSVNMQMDQANKASRIKAQKTCQRNSANAGEVFSYRITYEKTERWKTDFVLKICSLAARYINNFNLQDLAQNFSRSILD